MRSPFPTAMIDDFIKTAETAAMKPIGGGDRDVQRAQQGYNRSKQTYSQPNSPTDQTQPGTADSQRMLQPPSV